MNYKFSLQAERKGFALVATLLLMILLSILVIGMLSLSAVSLRTSSQISSMTEARANARLALMTAIGELQRSTGADTRITAQAEMVTPGAPPVTGVWRSWEGLNHERTGTAAGRPIKPNYDIKTKAYDPEAAETGRFMTWLVSGVHTNAEFFDLMDNNPDNAPLDSLNLLSQGTNKIISTEEFDAISGGESMTSVPLLAAGSLGETDTRQIHVIPQPVKNVEGKTVGSFAWWVSPENQKARLAQPHQPRTNDAAGWVENGQSHPVPNAGVFGLDSLVSNPEPFDPSAGETGAAGKAITLGTVAWIQPGNAAEPHKKFHDLSTNAVGLLTNSATGGWRKDLSILTEKWDTIYTPASKLLPLFRFSPEAGKTTAVPKPTTTNNDPLQSNLYPWSEYSLILGYKQPATYHAASASWASLQSFATSYKNFSYSSDTVKSQFVWDRIAKQTASAITTSEFYNHKHKHLLYPQIARFQFLVYATAIEDPARLNQNPKKYQMRLRYVPIFTLWNPYNFSLETTISGTLNGGQNSGTEKNFRGFGWRRSVPGVMAIANKATYPDPSLVPITQYRLFTPGNIQSLDDPANNAISDPNLDGNKLKYGTTATWRDVRTVACWLPEGTHTFKPGQAKVYSPVGLNTGYGFGGYAFILQDGYKPSDIVGIEFGHTSNLLATQSFWFLFKNDRVTQPYKARVPGNGFSLSFGDGGSHFGGTSTVPSGIGSEFHNITSLANESQGNKYWPPSDLDEVGYSVGELEGQWIPLYSVSFGSRMTIGTGPGTKQNRPTKGVLQNNVLAGMVLSDPASGNAKDHPANNTFDFAYHSLRIGSTVTPNLSASAAYIATGYQSGDGLSRLIMAEIPVRPMSSLVELQGWNPRGHNPYPPFQMNLIGNSDATPLIPKDNIVPPTLSPPVPNPNPKSLTAKQANLQHDDAYCANHLLFDDWFVSSIAPQPNGLGGSIAKTIETVYREYLKGDYKLSNRAYQPIAEDSEVADSVATTRIAQVINSPQGDGWLKVASRFEVDGMFNVNSPSVDAWKAILGHAKNREEIGLHGANGIVSVNTTKDHPVTRGALATDVEAGSGTATGGGGENSAEYAGFRSLTDADIDDLAEKIVEQVRLRGPFLSLSEFVNRQLSTNDDLALAGALQTAINNLDNDPMAELRNPDNMLSDTTMQPTGASDDPLNGVNYEFPEASEGDSAHGVPGWIRQADILRPIAPILSARDDTFTVRAYGDSRDSTGKILATAWCEATVQRGRDFVDPADAADSIDAPTSPRNQIFGRKYVLKSFRWLNEDEV